MKKVREFDFSKARRITPAEVKENRKAIEALTGKKRAARGRPAKTLTEKFVATSIRLHPKVLAWAKKQAQKRGCGYQTVINEALLEKAI